MRFGVFLTAAVAALGISSAQGISTVQAGTIHNAWEKFRANHALHHLSKHAQRGMVDVLNARMHLVQGDSDAAVALLIEAQRHFKDAKSDTSSFIAAEDQLHVSLSRPVSRGHTPVHGTVQWIPVGGEFVETETIAPEKRDVLKKTNKDIKAGDNQQINEDLEIVGNNADFVMALAPAKQLTVNLGHAQLMAEARHPHSAIHYIDRALDSIVYVDDDLSKNPDEVDKVSSSEQPAHQSLPPAPVTSSAPADSDVTAVHKEEMPAEPPVIKPHILRMPMINHHHHCASKDAMKMCPKCGAKVDLNEGQVGYVPTDPDYPRGPVDGQ